MELIRNFIMDRWHSIKRVYLCTKRALEFAKIGYGNFDWDHGFLLELINFKMTRMYDAFLKEDIVFNAKREFRSLNICLKLYKKRNYSKNIESVYDRWGRPTINKDSVFGYVSYKNASTPELKKILTREIASAYNADIKQRNKYEDLYFRIFKKYYKTWWT